MRRLRRLPDARPPACRPQVGARYTLLKVLGYGSYSAVVLALDNTTGERVRARLGGAPLAA